MPRRDPDRVLITLRNAVRRRKPKRDLLAIVVDLPPAYWPAAMKIYNAAASLTDAEAAQADDDDGFDGVLNGP